MNLVYYTKLAYNNHIFFFFLFPFSFINTYTISALGKIRVFSKIRSHPVVALILEDFFFFIQIKLENLYTNYCVLNVLKDYHK